MVSSVRSQVGEPGSVAAQRQREAKRWSLFLSVFGALAASALLWVGIFLLIGWVGRATAGLFGG